MSFKKNKYCIIKNAVDKDLAMFLYNYFHMKKKVYDTCRQARYISPFETMFGFYEQPGTPGAIVPHTYCSYADIALETLLEKLKPIVEKTTGLKVQPAYSFARLYKNGDVLPRHKDRFSCEISTTIYLGGDEWPIYLDPKNDKIEKSIINYKSQGNKGVKVDLKAGDMLIYRGCELEHWREKFTKNNCFQAFLHYNNVKTKGSADNLYDKRLHLGLPNYFVKNSKLPFNISKIIK